MNTESEIKDQAARDCGIGNYANLLIEIRTGQFSKLEQFTDRCIALASQVEAGITIEQAKDFAAMDMGYEDFKHLVYDFGMVERDEIAVVEKVAQIYAASVAQSAQQTAIEKERELIRKIEMLVISPKSSDEIVAEIESILTNK